MDSYAGDELDEGVTLVPPNEWAGQAAPLPSPAWHSMPKAICRAIKKDGERCRRTAQPGTTFCTAHGGGTVLNRQLAARRLEAIRSAMFEDLCEAAVDAVETYTQIMKNGERDADRLRAADRILELIGVRDEAININLTSQPASPNAPEEDIPDIDRQLRELLASTTREKIAHILDVDEVNEGDSDERRYTHGD